MPLNFTTLIFRADKFSPTGEDQIAQAEQFRRSLRIATLSEYLNDPSGGATEILPQFPAFAVPFKTTADELIAKDAITFLKQLQTAVAAPNTPPMMPAEQTLSDRFDRLFGSGDFGSPSGQPSAQGAQFIAGAQVAHKLIVDRYLTHRGPTHWIHFTNIGDWGDQVIERSSITEFCQYCNGISEAAYYHTFWDGQGVLLDGSDPAGYVLTFPTGELPEAERFWSLTAYTPQAIELVDNAEDKYVVCELHARAAVQCRRLALGVPGHGAPAGRPRGQLAPGAPRAVQHHAPHLRRRAGQSRRERHLCPAGHREA
jgi:hypothetical protein